MEVSLPAGCGRKPTKATEKQKGWGNEPNSMQSLHLLHPLQIHALSSSVSSAVTTYLIFMPSFITLPEDLKPHLNSKHKSPFGRNQSFQLMSQGKDAYPMLLGANNDRHRLVQVAIFYSS